MKQIDKDYMRLNSSVISKTYNILGDSKMNQILESKYRNKILKLFKKSIKFKTKANMEKTQYIKSNRDVPASYLKHVDKYGASQSSLKKLLLKSFYGL